MPFPGEFHQPKAHKEVPLIDHDKLLAVPKYVTRVTPEQLNEAMDAMRHLTQEQLVRIINDMSPGDLELHPETLLAAVELQREPYLDEE